jgi:thioredoxin reductase
VKVVIVGASAAGCFAALLLARAGHVEPSYEDQAAIDAAWLAMLRHTIFDAPAPPQASISSDRVTFAQLRAAARFNATASARLESDGNDRTARCGIHGTRDGGPYSRGSP